MPACHYCGVDVVPGLTICARHVEVAFSTGKAAPLVRRRVPLSEGRQTMVSGKKFGSNKARLTAAKNGCTV